MEVIYVGIAVIAAGIGFFVYSRYFKNSGDMPEISEDTVPILKPESQAESVPDIAVDRVTIDQKYADARGMWICMYCETLNAYPPGRTVRRKTAEEPLVVPIEGKSGLRGDLLKKASTNRNHPADESDVLMCIACGKRQ